MTVLASTSRRQSSRRSGIAAVLFVVIAVGFLHRIGAGELAPPPVLRPQDLGDWLATRDPTTATFALLRLVGLGAGWYLIATTTLHLVAHLTRSRNLGAAADSLSTPTVRNLASGLLGLTLTLQGSAGADEAGPPGATLERIADADGTAVLRRLADTEVIVELADDEDDDDGSAVMRRIPDEPVEVPDRSSWLIECGDHPWSIAEDVLTDHWGRPPTDVEIAPFWRAILARNDLPNPDLVFPGQTLELPSLPD
jgi:hypothetical protein